MIAAADPCVSRSQLCELSIKPRIKEIGQKVTQQSGVKVGSARHKMRCPVQTRALLVMFAPGLRIIGGAYKKYASVITRSRGITYV